MRVGTLRKALETASDDTPVVGFFDGGYGRSECIAVSTSDGSEFHICLDVDVDQDDKAVDHG